MDDRSIELLVVVVVDVAIVAFEPAFLKTRKQNLHGHLLILVHLMLVPEIRKEKFIT